VTVAFDPKVHEKEAAGNLHSIIIEKLQKYTDLKEEVVKIWQMKTAYAMLLLIFTKCIIQKKNYTTV
jgi:hypothetical protein